MVLSDLRASSRKSILIILNRTPEVFINNLSIAKSGDRDES